MKNIQKRAKTARGGVFVLLPGQRGNLFAARGRPVAVPHPGLLNPALILLLPQDHTRPRGTAEIRLTASWENIKFSVHKGPPFFACPQVKQNDLFCPWRHPGIALKMHPDCPPSALQVPSKCPGFSNNSWKIHQKCAQSALLTWGHAIKEGHFRR